MLDEQGCTQQTGILCQPRIENDRICLPRQEKRRQTAFLTVHFYADGPSDPKWPALWLYYPMNTATDTATGAETINDYPIGAPVRAGAVSYRGARQWREATTNRAIL